MPVIPIHNNNLKGGSIDIQALMNKYKIPFTTSRYPDELHLLGHSFTGPGTDLEERSNPDLTPKDISKAFNVLDKAAYKHHLSYAAAVNLEDKHVADREMLSELSEISPKTNRQKIVKFLVTKITQL